MLLILQTHKNTTHIRSSYLKRHQIPWIKSYEAQNQTQDSIQHRHLDKQFSIKVGHRSLGYIECYLSIHIYIYLKKQIKIIGYFKKCKYMKQRIKIPQASKNKLYRKQIIKNKFTNVRISTKKSTKHI